MSIDIHVLEGSPHEMGGRHGEALAEGARAMCETRIELCLRAAEGRLSRTDLLALAGESLPTFADFAPETYAEFCGIAEGAGVSREELLIGNGYTDFVDLVKRRASALSECTAFAVAPVAGRDGRSLVGQTWDMSPSAYPYVVALRRLPRSGPASITMTTTGCLSLVGINEHGIAVGNTNLVPADARNGVIYLATIHEALAQRTFADAVRVVTDAPRVSGHYFYVGGPHGEIVGIETTALSSAQLAPDASGLLAHANHYMTDLRDLAAGPPGDNSLRREARMWELLRAEAAGHDVTTLTQALSDHETPICRHDRPGAEARTCSAAIMRPADRRMWMTKGNPCEGEFIEVPLN
jgi:isopenicillin-N N-acyltransferase-like protein